MYEKGTLVIVRDGSDDLRFVSDVKPGDVYLPHSCDEWVIGGKEQIEALIEDLNAALQ